MTMIVCENSFSRFTGIRGLQWNFIFIIFGILGPVLESRTEKSGFWGFFSRWKSNFKILRILHLQKAGILGENTKLGYSRGSKTPENRFFFSNFGKYCKFKSLFWAEIAKNCFHRQSWAEILVQIRMLEDYVNHKRKLSVQIEPREKLGFNLSYLRFGLRT